MLVLCAVCSLAPDGVSGGRAPVAWHGNLVTISLWDSDVEDRGGLEDRVGAGEQVGGA
jgi:hypothetical protein